MLNGLLHRRNVDAYVTGSNSKLLSTDVMTEFRGRGDEVRVHPLNFAEFMQGFDGDRQEGWAEYIMYGGLPLVLSMRTPEQKISYLMSLFDEVYLSDVVERSHLTKSRELENLVNVLASSIGALTNPSKLKATFKSKLHSKLGADAIKRYLECLEEAFLVSEATRYDVRGRKYIGSPKKYYFEDVGLRNARLASDRSRSHTLWRTSSTTSCARGFSADDGVVDRLMKVDGRDERRRYEVDFVANLGYRRYYIQSALRLDTPEKSEQEKCSLRLIDDSFRKIVVVNRVMQPYMDDDGILTMGLFDFLLDENSLD